MCRFNIYMFYHQREFNSSQTKFAEGLSKRIESFNEELFELIKSFNISKMEQIICKSSALECLRINTKKALDTRFAILVYSTDFLNKAMEIPCINFIPFTLFFTSFFRFYLYFISLKIYRTIFYYFNSYHF